MRGIFNLSLFKTGSLKSEDFIEAKNNGTIMSLLDSLESKRNIAHANTIHHTLPSYIFKNVMGGPEIDEPYRRNDFYAGFGSICLLYTDSESSYNDSSNDYCDLHGLPESVDTSHGGKRFIEDGIIDPQTDTYPQRERMFFRNAFLYLPNEVVSDGSSNTEIKSIGVYYSTNVIATTHTYKGSFARIRLKEITLL